MNRRRLILAAVAVVAAVASVAYVLGEHNAETATWHTVTVDLATVGGDEEPNGHRLISIDVDDWTYAIQDSVAWIDQDGVYHDSGWPTCLEPRHPGTMDRNHEQVTFRFAETTVDVETMGWREVLMVDCSDRTEEDR